MIACIKKYGFFTGLLCWWLCVRKGHEWKTMESYPKEDRMEVVAFDIRTQTVRRAMACERKHKVACLCCGAVEMREDWWTEVRDDDFSQ